MRIHPESVFPAEANHENFRRELLALEQEGNAELRGAGFLHLAGRLERSGNESGAAQIYAALASDSSFAASLQDRARRRGAVLHGEGTVGDRVEHGMRRFFTEATDPASLAAMAAGGLAFRSVRLATLGRLAVSPSSYWTRGWMARAVASFAGFSAEAPLFALSAKLGHQFLGHSQDWSAPIVGREIAASYLFLGALRVSGSAAASAYRRVGGLPGSPLQTMFTQAGMFTGILGAHALNVQAGLAEAREGSAVLVDCLAMLLQFNVAGRLSQHLLGDGGRALERELDLRSENLSTLSVMHSPFGSPHVFSMAHDGPPQSLPSSPRRPMNGVSSSSTQSIPRETPSARRALRRLLDQSRPLDEAAKREVIRRIQAGDSRAEAELIRSDIRWVYKISKRYRLEGEERLDLLQEGQMGLLEAARRFDFSRDNKFTTYATWWVRHYMSRYVSNYLQEVRIPVHQLDMMRLLRQEMKELGASGEEITASDLAERLDVSPERLEDLKMLEKSRYVESLETKRGDDEGYDLHDRLPDKRPRADSQLVGRGLQDAIEKFIAGRAREHDRFVLENRLFSEEELSYPELAQRLGTTPARVRDYEDRLLGLLARTLESQGIASPAGKVPRRATLRSLHPERQSAPRPARSSAKAITTDPNDRIDLSPRIAIVGFGMAGVGAANALRNAGLFSHQAENFAPQLTVFEGMNRVGGKVAPDNRGAQFLDAANFYPMDRLIREHGLETTPWREDYDPASYEGPRVPTLPGRQIARVLGVLRQAARQELLSTPWEVLDQRSGVEFIRDLASRNGPLSSEEADAMVSRLGFEEGTLHVSALSFAINLAKSETPMPRYELLGGLHRLVEAEQAALVAAGGEVRLGSPVRGIEALADGVKFFFQEQGKSREESFDYAILALAPEHLRGFEVSGTEMPLAALSGLESATVPQPGAGYPVVRFAMDQYFGGRYDGERLRVANHTMGLGCYVRDDALSGELAALSLMRGLGLDLSLAQSRRMNPERELIGVEKIP